jgi:hypothetical protein
MSVSAPGSTGRRGRNMFAADTPNSATEQKRAEQLDVAHARADQDVRVFTLCDIRGRLILPHDLRPEHDGVPGEG